MYHTTHIYIQYTHTTHFNLYMNIWAPVRVFPVLPLTLIGTINKEDSFPSLSPSKWNFLMCTTRFPVAEIIYALVDLIKSLLLCRRAEWWGSETKHLLQWSLTYYALVIGYGLRGFIYILQNWLCPVTVTLNFGPKQYFFPFFLFSLQGNFNK